LIAVIDYGMGNLRSVTKAFEKLGADVEVVSSPKQLALADKVVLPGVGAFADTMEGIRKRGLEGTVREFISSGKPYLGICMGYQILFGESEEGGDHKGLGILKGRVKRFKPKKGLKVPHMGWNRVSFKKKECPLFKGIADDSYFYFVHSYYADPNEKNVVAGATGYGTEFASMVWRDNLYAVQFHPEKSQEIGLKMLKNFIEL